MMGSVPASLYPEAARLVALAGWSLATVLMAFQCGGSATRRWLTALFALCALHYAAMGTGWPAMEMVPAVLAMVGSTLASQEVKGWWYIAAWLGIAAGFLSPVTWSLSLLVLVTALYASFPFIGRAIFFAAAPLVALLICEYLPGFRATATQPAVFPVLVGVVIACQLWLPARLLTANGRFRVGR